VLVFLLYRLVLLPGFYYDWYMPPFTAMVALMAASGTRHLARLARPLVPVAAAVIVVAYAAYIPYSWPLEKEVQQRVELGVRRPAALYLAAHVPPGETVSSESAGYVGYYSSVVLYDFPGLTSWHSSDALSELPPEHRTLAGLVSRLQPAWILMRPQELDELRTVYGSVAAKYTVVATFDSDVPLERGGMRLYNIDRSFIVLRRTT
jgi:hypothetical protein